MWPVTTITVAIHTCSFTVTAVQYTDTFNGPFSGTTQVSNRKLKPIWILLKQETVSGSGISWAVCKSAPCSRQIAMPAPHHSVSTGWMPFQPTASKHWRLHVGKSLWHFPGASLFRWIYSARCVRLQSVGAASQAPAGTGSSDCWAAEEDDGTVQDAEGEGADRQAGGETEPGDHGTCCCKGSPYSIAERKVPKLMPVLGSQFSPPPPLSSDRQHLSYGGCLEVKGKVFPCSLPSVGPVADPAGDVESRHRLAWE